MLAQDKINQILGLVILFIIVIGGIFFGYKQYMIYRAEKQVESINLILEQNSVSRDNCKPILDFDKTLLSADNKFFDEPKYDKFRKKCDYRYNIANSEIKESFCINVIKLGESDFEDEFIILDDFKKIQNQCIDKFLKVEFGTWAFFDIEKDFKSSINIDFSLDFFEDTSEAWTEEFINNRIKAKEKLITLLDITPKVELNINNVILYKKRAILNLELKPKTEYIFKLKSFDSAVWAELKTENFKFMTPENKFFGFKINEKVSLFMDTKSPNFTFYKYNSSKKEAKIKICRIDNEAYAKIEVYNDFPNRDFRRNFFKTWIDKIKTSLCNTKVISLENIKTWSWTIKKDNKSNLVKRKFDFSKEIWGIARSWLYFVTFENSEDREYNKIIQKPIFFWIVDSHITMKLSANKKWFFFVNDFAGNPLPNQEIRVYLNNFKSKKTKYNYKTSKDESTYYSPFEKNVLSKPIYLWKTNNKGILNVDLKWKIDDAYNRTFDSYDYFWDWDLNSLFVTSASKTHLSYVSSKHNGWITPWNFGYSVSNWWYNTSENQDEITIKKWGSEPKIYSHTFTDRKLYLPNEEVHIKSILRNSEDLSIPRWEKINLIVKDSKWKELLNSDFKISDFGSINHTLKLSKSASLWNYYISLKSGEENIWNSGFSVEVFKNPKFKNEVMLQTEGLNGELVKITKIKKDYYWEQKNYIWDFKIKTRISSKYYNWAVLKNSVYTYKVYKQYYYDNSYWNDCYYGCYWEPEKKLYTEGKWILDWKWVANFDIPVKFESSYSDYKYIVEVTVKDKTWDIISNSNSIIAKLPSEHKRWDPNSGIQFKTDKRFYKSWEKIELIWNLQHWKYTSFYDDKFLLIIKKKEYETKQVFDVRWYKRPITNSKEKIEKILKVNTEDFILTKDWKLKFNYIAKTTWEYVFEFWKINQKYFLDSTKIIKEFQNKLKKTSDKKDLVLEKNLDKKIKVNYDNLSNLSRYCSGDKKECERKEIIKKLWCKKTYIDYNCRNKEVKIKTWLEIKIDDLVDFDSKKYFTIISYWDKSSKNPIISDNKLQILSEKISYNIWDKARILIRLPESEGKVLLTREKQWVMSSELINVKSNIFFKEFKIDDSFIPNAYIWAVFIPKVTWDKIPEYKVWYTEIVVDKTDKKTFINIKTDKKVYKPRETVKLDIEVKDKLKKWVKSELTVMVVDDSLISLMWNVDLNTLEKFYKKLPFRIQTSITNIAMLRNYYFSRRGIVGWSWFGNFKWWDSIVSSRNIFRNTAYYNANVITDWNWKAHVEFNLPDNLTNFRVMVVSNSVKNLFGSSESFIEVRKNVIVEDKTPLVLRNWDISKIGANIFNNTSETIWFKVELKTENIEVRNKAQNVFIAGGASKFISWEIVVPENIENLEYKISALWNNKDNSDIIENNIKIKTSPVLITNTIKTLVIPEFNNKAWVNEVDVKLPENIDIKKSKVEVIFSNNRLTWIDKIISSLARYPYGCLEQTISSTLPNAIVLKFGNIFPDIIKNKNNAKNNLEDWIERIKSMQLASWGFVYWEWDDSETGLRINSYVLSSLLEMKEVYPSSKLSEIINKNIKYLESKIKLENKNNISIWDKIEIIFALSKAWRTFKIELNSDKLDLNQLLKYTYSLYYSDKTIFKSEIDRNIVKLKELFKKETNNSYYYNSLDNKAIFASLLLDLDYDNSYTEKLITDLYSKNWTSYYHSTKTKNSAFLAFSKYVQKHSINKQTRYWFSLWNVLNREDRFFIWWNKKSIKRFEYKLSDLLWKNEDTLSFRVANLSKWNLYADVIIKQYPKDILKVKSYSNKVKVKREIYEVLDETNLSKCTNYWNSYYWNYSEKDKNICNNTLKLVTNNTYKKWWLYRVKVSVNFEDNNNKNDFVLEDYLPWSFRVINSKFKTESVIVTQNTKNKNWSWDHIEYRPNVVMAHNEYVWWNKKEFSYYVRAEFGGLYIQPPVTWYMMYNPIIRWNSEFNIIEVK